ncbi:MAG: competence/damage-inducible protein A, partial [Bacteroidota bacterium]
MKVGILTIGDEILIGQIVDTNSAWMGNKLNEIGAEIGEIRSVPDTEEGIIKGVDDLLKKYTYILCTGGLGPTKDDITKKTLASYFESDLVFHDPTYNRIKKLFEKWGRSMTVEHKAQCYMPSKSTLLYNKMGTAPGMLFEKEGKYLVSMPGVPHEMKYLMEHEVLPKIKEHKDVSPIYHKTIMTIGEGESRIAKRINPIVEQLPENIS